MTISILTPYFPSILKDYPTSGELLSRDNVCCDALVDYAKEAAVYTTKGGLGELVFAPNYRGDKDVAMFDFTGMMYSDNASKILERKGKKLLLGIAGDSLFEVSLEMILFLFYLTSSFAISLLLVNSYALNYL